MARFTTIRHAVYRRTYPWLAHLRASRTGAGYDPDPHHHERLPGAEFSAHWRITHNGETVEHPETRGTVPAEFTFEGDTLEGTVKLLSDDERLEVDIVKGSNRSRSSTQGKGGTLTVVVR
ncbi:hypothetical protein HAALTHF_09480n [Vreelandella aquamarina]|nr:hypothetical protein HAALTHF_09480n [Halomonas axialensis]